MFGGWVCGNCWIDWSCLEVIVWGVLIINWEDVCLGWELYGGVESLGSMLVIVVVRLLSLSVGLGRIVWGKWICGVKLWSIWGRVDRGWSKCVEVGLLKIIRSCGG